MRSTTHKTDVSKIGFYDTMLSLFGNFSLTEERHILRKNPIFQEFQQRIGEINSLATDKGIDVAYAFLIINREYGYGDWIKVPYGKLDELKIYVKNNIHNWERIIYG